MRSLNVCFLGHRPSAFSSIIEKGEVKVAEFSKQVEAKILEAVKDGYNHFLCGMNVGFDLFAATIVLRLRAENPELKIRLTAVLRHKGHSYGYTPWQIFHSMVLNSADSVEVLNCEQHSLSAPRIKPLAFDQPLNLMEEFIEAYDVVIDQPMDEGQKRYIWGNSGRMICDFEALNDPLLDQVRAYGIEIVNISK